MSFNSSTQPISRNLSRPSGRGSAGGKRSFTVSDRSNSALLPVATPTGMRPANLRNAPMRTLGSPQQMPSSKRAKLMTGIGSTKEGSKAHYGTGMGGMSDAAFRSIERFMPANIQEVTMPGTTPQPGQYAGSEYGAPYFKGFGGPNTPGINMFREGAINPLNRTDNGMAYAGFPERPTHLDANAAIHPPGNPDPRRAPGTLSGPNGSPLASSMAQTAANAREMTEETTYEHVNPIVQHGNIIRPFSPNFDAVSNYGMFMVVNRSPATLKTAAKVNRNRFVGSFQPESLGGAMNRYVMLNVTAFNYMLAKIESAQSTKTALDVMKTYELFGAVINEEKLNVTNTHSGQDTGSSERLVNFANQGPCTVCNYWGNKALKCNVRLFFVLRRVPRTELAKIAKGVPYKSKAMRDIEGGFETPTLSTETIFYNVGGKNSSMTVYPVDNNGERLHPAPFQLVPYVHEKFGDLPPSIRTYYDPVTGFTEPSVVIGVGHSDYPLGKGKSADGFAGITDAKRLSRAGHLRMNVSIVTHC